VLQKLLLSLDVSADGKYETRELVISGKIKHHLVWKLTCNEHCLAAIREEGSEYFNVAQKPFAVDEVIFDGPGAHNVEVAHLEVSVTPPPATLNKEREVLLMQRQDSRLLPKIVAVSNDAILWNMNEVRQHGLYLRNDVNATGQMRLEVGARVSSGGCCQISADNVRCANYEYPDGNCVPLERKSIGCDRGWWNEAAYYDESTGNCVEQVEVWQMA